MISIIDETLDEVTADHGDDAYQLTRPQLIRNEAMHVAAYLLGDDVSASSAAALVARLVELAEPIADYIRSGERPA